MKNCLHCKRCKISDAVRISLCCTHTMTEVVFPERKAAKCSAFEENEEYNDRHMTVYKGLIHFPIIENGSYIEIGKNSQKITVKVDQHFNRFQKAMIRWCFGFKVTDYSD